MGTHPTAPSLHAESHDVLSKHVAENLDLVGKPVVDRFVAGNGNLPFLFKVLSIGKALSIQTHPDKLTAEKLHAERPDVYKGDSNA
jgi:mannose-6-phosphate isomerase